MLCLSIVTIFNIWCIWCDNSCYNSSMRKHRMYTVKRRMITFKSVPYTIYVQCTYIICTQKIRGIKDRDPCKYVCLLFVTSIFPYWCLPLNMRLTWEREMNIEKNKNWKENGNHQIRNMRERNWNVYARHERENLGILEISVLCHIRTTMWTLRWMVYWLQCKQYTARIHKQHRRNVHAALALNFCRYVVWSSFQCSAKSINLTLLWQKCILSIVRTIDTISTFIWFSFNSPCYSRKSKLKNVLILTLALAVDLC